MEDPTPPKIRKPLDEAALAKLALAREKANAKRKELAATRATDREALVQTKLKERYAKNDRDAEKEAQRRSVEPAEEPTPVPEEDPPQPPPAKPKTKKQPVIIETSDSEEDDLTNARVYFVKRESAPAPTIEPTRPTAPPPDPHASLYQHMFGAM